MLAMVFFENENAEHLDARSTIEAAIEAALGDQGEVTGGGSGQGSSNVDIEVENDVSVDDFVVLLRTCMCELGIQGATVWFDLGDEDEDDESNVFHL